MSTTDSREAFLEWKRDEGDIPNYIPDATIMASGYSDFELKAWQAALAWQAAKATGTAGELPPLPESQADGDSTCDFHGRLFAYTAEDMREYGQACAEAAWNNCATLNQERIRQLTDAEAARQPAPVVAVKTWQERLKEGGWEDYTAMLAEIADLRAALAATAAPVLSDEQILANETLKYYFGLNGGKGPVSDKGHNIIQAVLTVATRSQP